MRGVEGVGMHITREEFTELERVVISLELNECDDDVHMALRRQFEMSSQE